MITGFLGVPLFKFMVANLPGVGEFFAALSELPPSFALSFLVAIIVSLTDKKGQAIIAQTKVDLDAAKAWIHASKGLKHAFYQPKSVHAG